MSTAINDNKPKSKRQRNPWGKLLSNTSGAEIARVLSTNKAPVTRAAVNTWLHGEHHPGHDNCMQIIAVYGKPPPKGLGITLHDIRMYYDRKRKERMEKEHVKTNKRRGGKR